jgi:hypothetical protein
VIALALLLTVARTFSAQGAREESTLIIRVDTQAVARETYSFGPSRLSGGTAGWVVSATTIYDRVRPVVVLSPTLEIAADSLPVTLQFDIANPREPVRVLGQRGRNRFTVRTVTRSLERAREFPMRAPAVVLDDSVFALFQIVGWFARPEPVTLTAVVARAGHRETLTLVDSGSAPVMVHGRSLALRHLTLAGGTNEMVHLWLDPEGRLVRLAIPTRKLVAEREPSD